MTSRLIELYLSEPTGSFCLLLDDADDILDFNEHDPEFWKKGLKVLDSEWRKVPTSQTVLPKGVIIVFDFMYGMNVTCELNRSAKPKNEVSGFCYHEKRQGLLNITITI